MVSVLTNTLAEPPETVIVCLSGRLTFHLLFNELPLKSSYISVLTPVDGGAGGLLVVTLAFKIKVWLLA